MTAPRKPAVRQRASTAAEIAASERVEAEVEAIDTEWIGVDFQGEVLRIMPAMDWPKDIYQAVVHQANFDALAEVMHEDDADAWVSADCTLREAMDFLEHAVRAAGQDMGESRASRRSARRTARR